MFGVVAILSILRLFIASGAYSSLAVNNKDPRRDALRQQYMDTLTHTQLPPISKVYLSIFLMYNRSPSDTIPIARRDIPSPTRR